MKEKKTIIITSVVLGVLVLILGVAYAAFNYTKLGITSKLIVGDIYMHYDENTTGINLTNALPTKTYDETNYFEFTIDGKNTYDKKDIYYELLLNLGDPVSGKTRIKDELLKFTLTRKNTDGTWETIIDSRSYETINNTKLFVETIPKNTTSEIVHTYRLYMWISNDVVICDGNKPDNCDYTLDEWKDIYASIKLDADGDFQEKTFYVSDPSCFGTKENDDGTLTIMYGKTASPEKPDICDGTDIIIPSEINGKKVTIIGFRAFQNNQLTSVVIPDSITEIWHHAFANNQLTSVVIPNSVTTIGYDAFANNQLTNITIPNSVTTIGEYAFFNNQLKLITIGNGIMYIGLNAFLKDSYSNPNLSKITIDKSCTYIKYIYDDSFDKNEYYPWLSTRSPYTASGVTIYGSNNEICDSF